MKFVVYTLGCKVNQYESQVIVNQLTNLGCQVVTDLVSADIYILNTCAVTGEAERKSRQMFSKIKKLNDKAKIIVCGCSAENNAQIFFRDDSLVIGVARKGEIINLLTQKGIIKADLPSEYEYYGKAYPTRTRAYIKVQDGCNNFCSYCIVPYLRGRSRSRSISSIVDEINDLGDQVKEVVITGINLSDFGSNINSSLSDLIIALEGVNKRIRLGSLEVNIINDKFLKTLKNAKNFCPHFHLSMQSGCNSILKKMNRHYTTAEFLDKINLIRSYFDNAGITTDVIAGFPTEAIEEHKTTVEFCKQVGFSDMHVFPYSIRTKTVASKMEQVDKAIIKQRARELTEIKNTLSKEYLTRQIGCECEILVEDNVDENNFFTGLTKNYIKVYFMGNNINASDLIRVKIISLYKDGVIAEPINC